MVPLLEANCRSVLLEGLMTIDNSCVNIALPVTVRHGVTTAPSSIRYHHLGWGTHWTLSVCSLLIIANFHQPGTYSIIYWVECSALCIEGLHLLNVTWL